MHSKVCSASVTAFRISLAILPHFVGYQARIFHFTFFNVLHKSLSFIIWNLIEYLHTQDFQRATAHLNAWINILLFCFVYGCKQHTKKSLWNRREGNLFWTCSKIWGRFLAKCEHLHCVTLLALFSDLKILW